jgi:hypothetical protein
MIPGQEDPPVGRSNICRVSDQTWPEITPGSRGLRKQINARALNLEVFRVSQDSGRRDLEKNIWRVLRGNVIVARYARVRSGLGERCAGVKGWSGFRTR